MIEVRHGNILQIQSGIIVHGCNCIGVMGGGIALQIKNQYPEAYKIYKDYESKVGLKLGTLAGAVKVGHDKFIVNALTQQGVGGKRAVSYDAIATCFEEINDIMLRNDAPDLELVFPQIGAGLGGGDWDIISTIIDKSVSDQIKKVVYIYAP